MPTLQERMNAVLASYEHNATVRTETETLFEQAQKYGKAELDDAITLVEKGMHQGYVGVKDLRTPEILRIARYYAEKRMDISPYIAIAYQYGFLDEFLTHIDPRNRTAPNQTRLWNVEAQFQGGTFESHLKDIDCYIEFIRNNYKISSNRHVIELVLSPEIGNIAERILTTKQKEELIQYIGSAHADPYEEPIEDPQLQIIARFAGECELDYIQGIEVGDIAYAICQVASDLPKDCNDPGYLTDLILTRPEVLKVDLVNMTKRKRNALIRRLIDDEINERNLEKIIAKQAKQTTLLGVQMPNL